ncbi:hypothetical protein OG828_48520 [Streptomyces sp. NBC_00457]|uniref:hypothetical protein n=1 Tax=Streptomyces sp. NBC_00457 TaxID=2975748 RepID=UPI002E1AF243
MALRVLGRARGEFEHPAVFWFGVLACTAGAALHLPMNFGARHAEPHVRDAAGNAAVITELVLIAVGLVAVLYGVLPARGRESRSRRGVSVSQPSTTPRYALNTSRRSWSAPSRSRSTS